MDGLDKIIERIASDTGKEVGAIIDAAKVKADALLASAKEEAAQFTSQARLDSQKAAELQLQRIVGTAELTARKNSLSAKQTCIDKAFESAAKLLREKSESDTVSLLAGLAASAARKGTEEIVMSSADHSRFGKKVAEAANEKLSKNGKTAALRLSASPRDLEGGGGLILNDGDIEINCSYGALIENSRNELSSEVAKILFA